MHNAALRLMALLGGALRGSAGMLIWRHNVNHASFWLAQPTAEYSRSSRAKG